LSAGEQSGLQFFNRNGGINWVFLDSGKFRKIQKETNFLFSIDESSC
jgi:hypothetical protein